MKTLIIAEKPSLAKDIMEMLTKKLGEKWNKKDGYSESENYYCSWFYGHLLQTLKPSEMNEKYKVWNYKDLPIIPEKLEYKYSTGERGTLEQSKKIKKLVEICDIIINACDPDREGEGIFQIFYNYEKITKPVKRFWCNSKSYLDMCKSWDNLKDGEEYKNLGIAQNLRQYSDWIIGMNATMAYSTKAGIILPIGRVKTPTLSMIVRRDEEVETFKKSSSYKLTGIWNDMNFEMIDSPDKKEILEKIKEEIKENNFKIKDKQIEKKNTNPPKPFSLPDLQILANTELEYDLDQTLEICQSLYEKKLITYPRSDSPYLPPSDLKKYQELFEIYATEEQKAKMNEKLPKCLKKTSESHTAIIPTGEDKKDKNLNEQELNIYNIIVSRFVTAFLIPMNYDETRIIITDSNYDFRTIIKNVTNSGFTEFQKKKEEEEFTEKKIDLEKIEKAEIPFKELIVKEIPKKKPSYYTPASLIHAMKTISKDIENKELKDILKLNKGIGSSATRDKYPKDLLKENYIYKNGKFLISTEKGRNLISIIHKKLKSAELTAEFELDLSDIETGEDPEIFKKSITEFTREIIEIENEDIINIFLNKDIVCPKCNKPLRDTEKAWFCSSGKDECDFVFWKKISGKDISEDILIDILKNKKSEFIKGFLTKDKKTFDAFIVFDENYKLKFSSISDIKCPKCNKPLKNTEKAWFCSSGKDECDFAFWKNKSSKKMTTKILESILKNKKTGLIKGFKSKNGKSFDAYLLFDKDYKVVFEFKK